MFLEAEKEKRGGVGNLGFFWVEGSGRRRSEGWFQSEEKAGLVYCPQAFRRTLRSQPRAWIGPRTGSVRKTVLIREKELTGITRKREEP